MSRSIVRLFVSAALFSIPLLAENFTFYSTLRAGRPAGADWEVGVGRSGSASDSTSSYSYDSPSNQYWRSGGLDQNFVIGWIASTNTAYATVYDRNGNATTSSIVKTGTPLNSNATWTLPATNFFASAAGSNQAAGIQLSNLTLAPGVQILSGALPSSLGASQTGNGTGQNNTISAPLVINPATNGGDWFISGSIRFTGLVSQGGSAQGSQLQFFLRATGSDTPESASFAMVGAGLIALVLLRRRKRSYPNS